MDKKTPRLYKKTQDRLQTQQRKKHVVTNIEVFSTLVVALFIRSDLPNFPFIAHLRKEWNIDMYRLKINIKGSYYRSETVPKLTQKDMMLETNSFWGHPIGREIPCQIVQRSKQPSSHYHYNNMFLCE